MQEINKVDIAYMIGGEEPLILDIGCYDGKDSDELSDYFIRPEIHCFEADPRSQELFEKVSGWNSNLKLHKFAVGSTDGPKSLFQSDSKTRRHAHNRSSWSASSSIRLPKTHLTLFPDVEFSVNPVEVDGISLDTWYKRFVDARTIDFIWCDVNGAEGDVVLGGLEMLNKHTRYLYIETSDKELYEGQVTKEKLLSLLPNFKEIGFYNFLGNFGNVLLKNEKL